MHAPTNQRKHRRRKKLLKLCAFHWGKLIGGGSEGVWAEGGQFVYLTMTTNNHKKIFTHVFWPPRTSFESKRSFSDIKNYAQCGNTNVTCV